MNIISKAIKGSEYMYSKDFMILCKSEKQALKVAQHLNDHNDKAVGLFKLNAQEIWYAYEIDQYDHEPRYKLINSKHGVKVREIY